MGIVMLMTSCRTAYRDLPVRASWADSPDCYYGQQYYRRETSELVGAGPSAWYDVSRRSSHHQEKSMVLELRTVGDRHYGSEYASERLGDVNRVVIDFSGPTSIMHPSTVLGIFLYRDDQHEFDFELSRWGNPQDVNAQFVMHPIDRGGLFRFELEQAKRVRLTMSWTQKSITYAIETAKQTIAHTIQAKRLIDTHDHRLHLNLWSAEERGVGGGRIVRFKVHTIQYYSPSGLKEFTC